MGKREKPLEKYEQSLEMYRAIHKNQSHLEVALSLLYVGIVYYNQKKLNYAADFLDQSLKMLRIVNNRNTLDPDITAADSFLKLVHAEQGGGEELCKKKRRV